MAYPEYPNNRLVVDGTDLTTEFGLIMSDGYSLEPPEPKTYTVDIPGGDGVLDLTDSLTGDVAYENRKQSFTFYALEVADWEALKRKVSNFLHGKAFDYTLSFDPDYTYHGRFKVTSYMHSVYSLGGTVGVFQIEIDANPYKMKPTQTFKMDAVGGKIAYFNSGRMRVRPTIECSGDAILVVNDKGYNISKGSWRYTDLVFTEGVNSVYMQSRQLENLTWGDLQSVTWEKFGEQYLFEWYNNGQTESASQDNDYIYISYEWGDL